MAIWGGDIAAYEQQYILDHPDSIYNRILRNTREFRDYLGILPEGAIGRKIGIMAYEVSEAKKTEMLFVSKLELDEFIEGTAEQIYNRIHKTAK